MSKAKYYGDLCFSNGEYQDKEGNTKKRWNKAGAVFQYEDGGMVIKLESVPLKSDDGVWLRIFEKQNDNQSKNNKFEDLGKPITKEQLDEIPF